MTDEPTSTDERLPLDEAVESLTGFEVLDIEKHYGKSVDDIGAIALMYGVIHAYENRDGRKLSWAGVKAMTLKEARAYFADPVVDPDSDEGKD